MSGKLGFTLVGLDATYVATQLGQWTQRRRNKMAGRGIRQRQLYYSSRGPRRRGSAQPRHPKRMRKNTRLKQKFHQSAT